MVPAGLIFFMFSVPYGVLYGINLIYFVYIPMMSLPFTSLFIIVHVSRSIHEAV